MTAIAEDIAAHVADALHLPDDQADRIARVVQGRLDHHAMESIVVAKRDYERAEARPQIETRCDRTAAGRGQSHPQEQHHEP